MGTVNLSTAAEVASRRSGLPRPWHRNGLAGIALARHLGSWQEPGGVVEDGAQAARQLDLQVLPYPVDVRGRGPSGVIDNRGRGLPGLVDDRGCGLLGLVHDCLRRRLGVVDNAFDLGLGLGAPRARRLPRLFPQLLGLGPGGSQDLLLFGLQLGPTPVEFGLRCPGLFEQLPGLVVMLSASAEASSRMTRMRSLNPSALSAEADRCFTRVSATVAPPYRHEQTGRELVLLLGQPVAIGRKAVNLIAELGQCLIHLCRPIAAQRDRKALHACNMPF